MDGVKDVAGGKHRKSPQGVDDTNNILSPGSSRKFDINPTNRTITTALGPLPLSPIMNPAFWEAKQRHKQAKPKPGRAQGAPRAKGNNSIERQLRRNPYALALATPLRQCGLTRVRVPNYFLQDFNLLKNPKTEEPWWVPRDLLMQRNLVGGGVDEVEKANPISALSAVAEVIDDSADVLFGAFASQQTRDSKGESAAEVDSFALPNSIQNDSEAAQTSINDSSSNSAPILSSDSDLPLGPSAYLLARQDLIRALSDPKTGMNERRLLGSSNLRTRVAGQTVWRADMDVTVLDLMRRGILSDLQYLARLCDENDRYYITRCFGWADVKFKHRGAVLWFEHPKPEDSADPADVAITEAAIAAAEPGPYATFDVESITHENYPRKEIVPVHNLPRLLGEDYAALLRRDAKVFSGGGDIFMLAGRRTGEVQKKLWKLQGYLVDVHGRPKWQDQAHNC